MEEKQEKKQEPELKGKMGIVWLVGILVIALGCVTVYTLKLCKENKELKQTTQQPQVVAQQSIPAQEENVNVVATEETKAEVEEDKNAKEVYGLSTKFKSLSDVAIKKFEKIYNQDKVNVNIAYDLNNDGKEEKITNKGNDIYLNSERIYKATSYTIGSIYIIDINNKDKQKELVLEELQDDGIIETTIYIYNSNKKIKKIKFDNDNDDLLYFDSNGKIISLDEITSNLTPLLAHGYYQYDGNKASFKKINLKNLSNQRFIIKGQNDDGDNYYSYFIIKNKKELNKLVNDTSLLKKYFIKEDTEITILSADDILKVKLKDGSIKYIYPIRGYLAG